MAAGGAAAAAAGLWFHESPAGGSPASPADIDLTDLAAPGSDQRDLTFFVAADTHFGVSGISELNRKQIEAMNVLPGSQFPPSLGGTVGRPQGVLVAGDLTDYGRSGQWDQFVTHYGLTGGDGLLKYPVQECTGNHDRYVNEWSEVLAGVQKRHGHLVRGWVWQGVCFLCLDMYPDRAARDWLARQLATIGRQRPIVLYFHYSIVGPYSDSWSADEKAAFADVISGYNVLGIFHGHYHWSEHYTWKGFDVYNVGSPRHMCLSFGVVHISETAMTVASLWWGPSRFGTSGAAVNPATGKTVGHWRWTHRKQIDAT